MVVLAYLIAVVLFWIINTFGGLLFRTAYFIFLVRVFGITDGLHRFFTQWFAELIATILGSLALPLSFHWFDETMNNWIIIPLVVVAWFITNREIKTEHQPNAQRQGFLMGVACTFMFLL